MLLMSLHCTLKLHNTKEKNKHIWYWGSNSGWPSATTVLSLGPHFQFYGSYLQSKRNSTLLLSLENKRFKVMYTAQNWQEVDVFMCQLHQF